MLTLKKVKELVEAPVHTKRVPSPKVLLEEALILMRKEFDHGSHLTVYQSGYVLFSAGKRNTVFHIHDCCGDYSYDAAAGRGDVIKEEYFENCGGGNRAPFGGGRRMEVFFFFKGRGGKRRGGPFAGAGGCLKERGRAPPRGSFRSQNRHRVVGMRARFGGVC